MVARMPGAHPPSAEATRMAGTKKMWDVWPERIVSGEKRIPPAIAVAKTAIPYGERIKRQARPANSCHPNLGASDCGWGSAVVIAEPSGMLQSSGLSAVSPNLEPALPALRNIP